MHSTKVSTLAGAAAALALAVAAASPAAAQVKVMSANGEVAMYTQKNLVDHMIVSDSVEVEMAQLVASRTQNAPVKDLATQLLNDDQPHLAHLQKLASKHDIGREPNPADTSGAHMVRLLSDLKAMPTDRAFDAAFVRAQIDHAQHSLDVLNMMKGAATDGDVKHDIDSTIPMLERHLAHARQVAAQLNIPE